MKIMVFDVPAECDGALTILKQYYEKAINDSMNEWIFIISTPDLESKNNVKILKYPWIKKSWFHRLYFDIFLAHRLVNKYKVNEVLSLQNIVIPKVKVKQTLYLHQSLPFVDYRFKFLENKKLWIYQNIIGKLIFSSIKRADSILVQTNWMKKACLKAVNVKGDKIKVVRPDVNINIKKYFDYIEGNTRTFFYPAGASYYKNHRIIVESFTNLKSNGIENFKVIFTLKGNENPHIKELYEKAKKNHLDIHFIGAITREEVFKYYQNSILIFPSYIETLGLPLLEARMHNTPILASDCEFSHEILDDYEYADFFDHFNSEDLESRMLKYLK